MQIVEHQPVITALQEGRAKRIESGIDALD